MYFTYAQFLICWSVCGCRWGRELAAHRANLWRLPAGSLQEESRWWGTTFPGWVSGSFNTSLHFLARADCGLFSYWVVTSWGWGWHCDKRLQPLFKVKGTCRTDGCWSVANDIMCSCSQSIPRFFSRYAVKEAKKQCNAPKNRYVDILPCEWSLSFLD